MSLNERTVRGIRLVEKLGGGGMGEVWRGRDERLGRWVAVKAIREDRRLDAGARARFLREARLLSQLNHPNICQLHGLVEEDGDEMLVLELVEGENLSQWLEHDPDDEQRLAVAIQIADALAAAHAMTVVHRDVKPENVMVTADGAVKVLDFGLARSTETAAGEEGVAPATGGAAESAGVLDSSEQVTQLGDVMGTPRCMSPEQARGETVTAASDVFSFGLVLQELLTGETPYDPKLTARELLHKAAWGDHRPVRCANPRVAGLLEKMTAVLPGDRPSASVVAEELRRIREAPGVARRRRAWTAAFVALVVLAVALAVLTVRVRQEARRAEREAQVAGATTDFLVELFENASPFRRSAEEVTAVDLLEVGERMIRDRFGDQPETRARLLSTLGQIQSGLGRDEQAVELLEDALTLEAARLGADSPGLSRLRRTLAHGLGDLGRFDRAEEQLELALATLGDSISAAMEEERASVLHELTVVRARQGRLDEAEVAGRRALEIRERCLGPEHLDTGATAAMLGLVVLDRGRYGEAQELLARALEIQQRDYPPGHPQVSMCMVNLATAYKELRRLEESEALYRQALESIEGRFGVVHPDTAAAANNLGVVLSLEGRHDEAEVQYRRAAEIMAELLGPDHPYVSIYRANLAEALHLKGRSVDALELYRAALDTIRGAVGARHPAVAEIERGMAAAEAALGHREEAERLLRDAIEVREEALGPEHPELGRALVQLGDLYAGWGRLAEARSARERALAILAPALGPGSDEVTTLRTAMAGER